MPEDTKTKDPLFDTYLSAMSSFCWAQDQAEKIVKAWMDQGRASREEGRKMLEELISQTRRNQGEFSRMIQDGMKVAISGFRLPTAADLENLQKKVEDLTSKIEGLEKSSRKGAS